MASLSEQSRTELLEGLNAFLRIPSVSAAPERKPDVRRAAEFCLQQLRSAGLHGATLIESDTGQNPLVYAEWLNAPGKPTLLLYGHYDVQPPDPLDEWISPPFELARCSSYSGDAARCCSSMEVMRSAPPRRSENATNRIRRFEGARR